tara:strand:+ start:1372 stop:1590 length:219 start_codon:yes stop_codon:yes gene_type:complete
MFTSKNFIDKSKIQKEEKTNQILNQEELIKGDLSKREIDFILNKLKDATYKGLEFELFYTVWVKLTRLRKKG